MQHGHDDDDLMAWRLKQPNVPGRATAALNQAAEILSAAWVLIANARASQHLPSTEVSNWEQAATKWGDDYHAWLRGASSGTSSEPDPIG